MILRPPRSTRTNTRLPFSTLFRSKAKSLSAILAHASRFTISVTASVAPPAAPAAAAAPAVDYASLLIGIVAERTGYPHEMLGLDADLEADLGIDSIKRVGILGALQKSLPADAGPQMQAGRSEERRVGEECVSTGRTRGVTLP